MNRTGRRRADEGFTLVELLIVIVVLGVLATIVVFAVQGIRTLADDNSEATDARVLASAEEGHMALHGVYADEATLVTAGLLREESQMFDINVLSDGESYLLIAEGSGGPPAWEVPSGQTVRTFGGGSRKLVILGVGQGTTESWWSDLEAEGPLADTQVIWVNGSQTVASVEAILATSPTYVIVPVSVPIEGDLPVEVRFVGQYLDHVLGSPHPQWWWGFERGPLEDALEYYRNTFGG